MVTPDVPSGEETAMSVITPERSATHSTARATRPETTAGPARWAWAAARLSLGWIFLWAFLDKTFGLGHETPAANAWIDGGSPTSGFLGHAPQGPFADFYNDLAGVAWVDWVFMIGLLGIGLALIFGVGLRIAAGAGALMMVLMWSAVLPPDNNPFMDDHLIYAILLIGLALAAAGRTLGLGQWWERTALVRRFPWLA
jgi:thiosulfate dehydrogenase (quinone) large subunit